MAGATNSVGKAPQGAAATVITALVRAAVSLVVPVVAFIVLYAGFIFLRDANAPKLVVVGVAIVWGVGGIALLFLVSNWVVERLPGTWKDRVLPFVFVGPALAILTFYLLIPAVLTVFNSLKDATSIKFVGLDNYIYAFTNPDMLTAIRNNVVWLVLGTALSTGLGLLIAVLADRSKVDRVAKTFPKLPLVCCHGFYPNVHAMVTVAFRNENVFVSPDMYTFAPGGGLYIEAANGFMKDQFLFGSSFPFRPMKQGVVDFKALGLTPDSLDAALWRNADRILGLGLTASATKTTAPKPRAALSPKAATTSRAIP